MDGEAVDCVTDNLNLSSPIERQPFYMMIETSGSNQGYIYLMIFLEVEISVLSKKKTCLTFRNLKI